MSSLSPLTIAALLASLAAHAGVAMYVGHHETSPAQTSAADVAGTIDVETVAVAEAAQPEVPPSLAPEPPPPAPQTVTPPSEAPHVQSVRSVETAPSPPAPTDSPPAPAEAPAVATAPAGDDSPHFAMVLGAAVTAAGGASRAGGGVAPGTSAPFTSAGTSEVPFSADGVDQLARLVTGPAPVYPTAARDDGIEADVPLDIVVDESGRVIDVRATRHVGSGLDESAAAAIRGYRFSPALRGGRAVKVRMRWTVVFRLS